MATRTIETNSPEETFALGRQIGEQAEPGEVHKIDRKKCRQTKQCF